MKGLILKDIINLKKQYKVLFVIFLLYGVLSLTSDDSAYLGSVMSIMMVMLTMTTISYDERSNWDRYALTTPISRSDIVFSKYILGFILSVAAFILNIIFQIVSGSMGLIDALPAAAVTYGIGLFFLFVILPVLFKFGVEKGRLVMMMILFVPSGIILLLSKTVIQLPRILLTSSPYIGVLLLLAAAFISVHISLAIYRKKEM